MGFIEQRRQFLLISLILLGTILRFFYLTHQSLWGDEIFDVWATETSFQTASNFTHLWTTENHPPLYIFFLKGWTALLGTSEFSFRSFSAVIGILSLYSFFRLAEIIGNTKTAFIALALTVISPFWIYYSQEVRNYNFWVLLSTLSYIFFYKHIISKKDFYFPWLIFTICAFYTHIYTLLVLLSQILIYIVYTKNDRPSLKQVKHLALLMAFLIPLFFWAISKQGHGAGFYKPFNPIQLFYLPYAFTYGYSLGPSVEELHRIDFFRVFVDYFFSTVPSLLLVVITLAFGLMECWKDRLQKITISVLGIIALIIMTTPLYSLITFNVRSALFLAPFFYYYLSVGTLRLLSRKTLMWIPIGLVAYMVFAAHQYYFNPTYYRDDLRGVAKLIKKEPHPVLISGLIPPYALDYYGVPKIQTYEIHSVTPFQLKGNDELWVLSNREWGKPVSDVLELYLKSNYETVKEESLPGIRAELLKRK